MTELAIIGGILLFFTIFGKAANNRNTNCPHCGGSHTNEELFKSGKSKGSWLCDSCGQTFKPQDNE